MRWLVIVIIMACLSTMVQAEIINERTEKRDIDRGFEIIKYQRDNFKRIGDTYYDYNALLSNILDTNFYFVDGTEVQITPFIVYKGKVYSASDYPQINLSNFVERNNDSSKFTVKLNKIDKLTAVGFGFESNKPITYEEKVYFEEGYFEDTLPKEWTVTEIKIGDYVYSWLDLAMNFNATFDNGVVWINISNMDGLIELDPILTFYANSNDGHTTYFSGSCQSATGAATYMYVGENFPAGLPDSFYQGWLNFNTSGDFSNLTAGYTITDVKLEIYANSYLTKLPKGTSITWNVNHYNYTYYAGTSLDCGDWKIGGDFTHTYNFGGTTGWKNYSFTNDNVAETDWTYYELAENWGAAINEGYWAYINLRTTEYAGDFDPKLHIVYTEPSPPSGAKPVLMKKKEAVWPLAVFLVMVFIATRKNGKKKTDTNVH